MAVTSLEKACREWLAYCQKNYPDWYVKELLAMWLQDHRQDVVRVAQEQD